MPNLVSRLVFTLIAVATCIAMPASAADAQAGDAKTKTIVLVHGAFADGSPRGTM